MADELVEPQEIVPDQAEMFRQEVEPQPEPAPVEPAPVPEPVVAEPEPPPVEPDWLSAPVEPQPEPASPQQQQYYEPPPQYPQQPPQRPRTDAELEAFVDNPDAWLNQRLAQRDQQLVGPIAQQQQQVNFMMNTLMENNINDGVTRADGSIRNAYESFNKDATFRSNKVMQDKIGATLQGMRERATSEARRGNFGPLNALANLSESDIAGTLAYVRAATGVQSPGVGPLKVEGAVVESSRSAVAEQSVEFDADTEAAIKRLGPAYRDRLIKARVATDKAGDFEG